MEPLALSGGSALEHSQLTGPVPKPVCFQKWAVVILGEGLTGWTKAVPRDSATLWIQEVRAQDEWTGRSFCVTIIITEAFFWYHHDAQVIGYLL